MKKKEIEVSTLYLALDNIFAGRTNINGNYVIAKNNSWVSIVIIA